MKKIFLPLLIFFFFIFLFSADPQTSLNEFIRQEIEKLENKGANFSSPIINIEIISNLYIKRVYDPIWSNLAFTSELISQIKHAEYEGLDTEDYHFQRINLMFEYYNDLSLKEKAFFDLLASDAFLLYARHLTNGKINPKTTDPDWHIEKHSQNPQDALETAISENQITRVLQGLVPTHQKYGKLKMALEEYKNYEANGGWPVIPQGELLEMDMSDDRIALVKKRLNITGELKTNNTDSLNYFDSQLQKAVIAYKKRHNLAPNGKIDSNTIEAMNISAKERVDQIKVNLERWRWLPPDFGDYHINVNIPDFSLAVYENDTITREHKIIIGRTDRETPVFDATMTQLIFNPTWTVPPGILKKDIIPVAKKKPGYLNRLRIRVYDRQGNTIDPGKINWNSPGIMSYKYIQEPVPSNPMGVVKFIFPNKYFVYFHDTPSRELFSKRERTFSSGCIRVNHALDLAKYVLKDQEKWDEAMINKTIASGKTTLVNLQKPPRVFILYWTAWVDENGIIQFRDDIYQRDQLVLKGFDLIK